MDKEALKIEIGTGVKMQESNKKTEAKMKTYYTCVTYSGSTCMCRTLQHTNNECGHKHRTEAVAQKCLNKLENWSKDGRSCSATWYHGRVVERESAHNTEVICVPVYDDDYNYTHDKIYSAYEACTC